MALTENGKRYIAQYLGIVQDSDFCFSDTNATTVKYWDATDVSHLGSTIDAVATIFMFGGYSYEDKVAEIGRIDNAKLTIENDGLALTNDDIVWIAGHSDGVDKYCFSLVAPTPTPTPTPPPGIATLWLATDPGCCAAWIDKDPMVDPASIVCTKDATKGLYEKIDVPAPATHFIYIKKTGFEDFYDDNKGAVLLEGENWYVMPSLTAIAGADVALLTVNAYKDELKPAKVAVENAVVKKGTKIMGFAPYSDYWPAKAVGTVYDLSVVADGRKTYEEKITLIKDTPKTIDAYMSEKKLEIKIRIAPGVAFIDDISGGDYQVWYIGTKVEGWVRVETFMEEPTMFKAELTFCTLGTETPVPGIPKIITEEKLLHPAMTATEKHLDWPPWLVPAAPGEYSLVAELFYFV